jgi:hypothetical protein
MTRKRTRRNPQPFSLGKRDAEMNQETKTKREKKKHKPKAFFLSTIVNLAAEN